MEIKDFLHLYLGCECITDDGKRGTFSGFDFCEKDYSMVMHTVRYFDKDDYDVLNDDTLCDRITLLLRPLSDMTEEEKVKIFKLSFGEDHNFDMFGYDPIEQIILADKDGRTRAGISLNSMGAEVVRYLLSQGFDLFGLCDAGLAIDRVTTLNPKQ